MYPPPYLKSREIRPGDTISVVHFDEGRTAVVATGRKITFDELCRAIGRRLMELGYIPPEGDD